jgi:hypothetical protein
MGNYYIMKKWSTIPPISTKQTTSSQPELVEHKKDNDIIVLSMSMLSFIDPTIVLSMFMLSFIFVIVCGLFDWNESVQIFYRLFILDSTIAVSMNDNINMDSTIAVSMNDNIDMDSTIAG